MVVAVVVVWCGCVLASLFLGSGGGGGGFGGGSSGGDGGGGGGGGGGCRCCMKQTFTHICAHKRQENLGWPTT